MPLSPSDRIKIIAAVATRLDGAGWSLIDLTLKQFGQPTTNEWGGSQHDYVIQMLDDASDNALSGLAHHVGFEIDNPTTVIDPTFWKDGYVRVFISHLATHRQYAGTLKRSLEDYGFTSFVAHTDIHPTQEWQDEILTALSTAEVLLALLHEGFDESAWTDQEVGFAMGRGIPTFSVRFGQDPYGFIGRFQAFNGNGKSCNALAKEVFDALRVHKSMQRRMSEVIVTRFEESGSFADAKANMALLEDLQHWTKDYTERVRKAVKNNSQVADAYGVPEKVKALVKKWTTAGIS